MKILQDQAKPVGFNEIRELLEKRLGKKLEDIFQTIQETPIGMASIGVVGHSVVVATSVSRRAAMLILVRADPTSGFSSTSGLFLSPPLPPVTKYSASLLSKRTRSSERICVPSLYK